jgi:hypothetical protein
MEQSFRGRAMLKAILAVTSAFALTACGSTLITQLATPPGKAITPHSYLVECLRSNHFLGPAEGDQISAIASRLMQGVVPLQVWQETDNQLASETTQIDQLRGQPGYVNLFLDCYIAPVAQDQTSKRLLRGHIVTTLLAQYASASLIAKERAAKPDDAAQIIFHVRRASIHLMTVSPDALEAMYGLKSTKQDERVALQGKIPADARRQLATMMLFDLPNFRNAQRVAAVFDIGVDIARVDGRAALQTAGTIFDVVSTTVATGGFNPSVVPKLQGLLESAVAGLSLTAQSAWYGSAFMRDGQEALLIHMRSGDENMGPLWMAWQARINAACDSLKAVADTRLKPCEPTAADMVEYLKREFPDHPYLPALKARVALDVQK